MGGVCITKAGDIEAVFTRSLAYFVEPKHAEALCIREALSWIKDLQIDNVKLLLDSALSVEAIRNDFTDDSYFGLIISDCKVLLSSFDSVSIEFVHRASNILAHKIARSAVHLPNYVVWGGPWDFYLYSAVYAASLID